jgi:type VI protein secretion system component VasK
MADEMNIFLEDSMEDFLIPSDDFKIEDMQPIKQEETDEVITEEIKEVQEKNNIPPDVSIKKDNEPSSSNILSQLVSTMQEEGWFELKDGEVLDIKTPQDFEQVLEKIRETALETEQSEWSDVQKEYFNALRNGVPHEEIVQHQQMQQTFASITDGAIEEEGNEVLRKNILTAYYTNTGLDKEEAEEMVEKIIKDGEDIDKAKKFRDKLKVIEANNFKKQEEANAEAKKQEAVKFAAQQKEFKAYIEKLDEVIPGEKLTPKLKKEVNDLLIKPVSYDEAGNPRNIIGDFFAKEGNKGAFKLAYLLKITEGFTKMDNLSVSKAKKDVTSKVAKLLQTPSSAMSFTKEDSTNIIDDIDWDKILEM